MTVGSAKLKDDARKFLSEVRRANGASLGNLRLRSDLGWSESRYWRVHSALVEEGKIAKGRGRGGSVMSLNQKKAEMA